MTIGLSNGVFYGLQADPLARFSDEGIRYCQAPETQAIELHCLDETMVDRLLNGPTIDLSYFSYISVHTPNLSYNGERNSQKILTKLNLVCKRYSVNNLVFHTDKEMDWATLASYKNLPISLENMDERKTFGKTVSDLKPILDRYGFKLTLDLQHCFVNDPSMQTALEFQEEFSDRLAEYHISGFQKEFLHYPLFKTKQKEIINSLQYRNIPIIIESSFDQFGEQEHEIRYIKNGLL
jgi:hypothetical protein